MKEMQNQTTRSLKTASKMLKEKGVSFTCWYSVWKVYYLLYKKRQNQTPKDSGPSLFPIKVGGLPMYFHPSMKGLSETLYFCGVHEPLTTETYVKSLRPGDNIIEIGANIGYYVLLAQSIIGTSGRIIGFEPAPDNYDILKKNTEFYSNIEIFDLAIGNKNGNVEFYISEIPNWGSLIFRDNLFVKKKIMTRITRLDDFLTNLDNFRPTLIHMDIEGGEIQALEGANETISKYKPNLLIEFHLFATGLEPVADILANFVKLGYREFLLIDRLWDEPWIPSWLRNRRRKNGSLSELIDLIRAGGCPSCFSLFIKTD